MTYYHSNDPLREAIEAITGKKVPQEITLDGVFSAEELDDGETISLYDWCTANANPHWATGDSILEAAELIVMRAVENGNISTGASMPPNQEPHFYY